jgi:hypothetical protein
MSDLIQVRTATRNGSASRSANPSGSPGIQWTNLALRVEGKTAPADMQFASLREPGYRTVPLDASDV